MLPQILDTLQHHHNCPTAFSRTELQILCHPSQRDDQPDLLLYQILYMSLRVNSEAVHSTTWKGLLLQHADTEYDAVVAQIALGEVMLDS